MLVEGGDDASYVVVFDPLDGSSNIDASIPTGGALVPLPVVALGRCMDGTCPKVCCLYKCMFWRKGAV